MQKKGYAIVTGSSKGIGKAIAAELAGRGFDLILVARSEKLLQETQQQLQTQFKVEVLYYTIDLLDEAMRKAFQQWCINQQLPIQILVNNAGLSQWGPLYAENWENWRRVMQLNMNAVVHLCHLFIPLLEQNKKSYILNIGSISAFVAAPALGVYAASKAFIHSFSRALSYELKAKNITVTCSHPGYTESEMHQSKGMQKHPLHQKTPPRRMTGSKVAKISIDGLFSEKKSFITGLKNKINNLLAQFLPTTWVEAAVSKKTGFDLL